MPDHLFVYGTLRRGSAHPLAKRLAAEARFVGEGTVKGRPYSFGAYPGAVLDASSRETIEGDLYGIGENTSLLAALDAYEGCGECGDYCRVVVPVSLRSGGLVEAFAYALAHEDKRRPRIRGGKWRGSPPRKAVSR
jgi:gamma-glutamylcyclotransferase (GGCT)/AIG2-like uncharacterized protein YtfP